MEIHKYTGIFDLQDGGTALIKPTLRIEVEGGQINRLEGEIRAAYNCCYDLESREGTPETIEETFPLLSEIANACDKLQKDIEDYMAVDNST